MNEAARSPVLMIGIDAAEVSLLARWMDEGSLPNLRRLRESGASGSLASTAEWLVGSPWPSFYTSTTPADHGLYHYLIWRPELMAHARPAPDWMPLAPFWRDIARQGRRVIALDVPLAYAPEPFPGIEVSGWATHEKLQAPASHPAELLRSLDRRHGRPPMPNEAAHLLRAGQLLEVRDQCVRTTEMLADAAIDLMAREPWDLSIVCFAATHRAGHQLWDDANMDGSATPAQSAALADALKAVYVATDAAIGRLLAAAGAGSTAIVFSLHGMGENVSRADVLREMLARSLDGEERRGSGPAVRARLSDRLRTLVPGRWRSAVKTRLPLALQDWLTIFWRAGGVDWSRTPALATVCDLDGYIRINLAGREAQGVVAPGADYDALCDRIEAGMRSFVDADTGDPVVDAIVRAPDLYPPAAPMHRYLPDLMIRWAPVAAARHRRLVSPTLGAIDWPMPGRHPQGRSGNHRPLGSVVAAGDGIAAGSIVAGASILDLAPTVYQLMGLPVPAHMQGRPIVELAGTPVAVH